MAWILGKYAISCGTIIHSPNTSAYFPLQNDQEVTWRAIVQSRSCFPRTLRASFPRLFACWKNLVHQKLRYANYSPTYHDIPGTSVINPTNSTELKMPSTIAKPLTFPPALDHIKQPTGMMKAGSQYTIRENRTTEERLSRWQKHQTQPPFLHRLSSEIFFCTADRICQTFPPERAVTQERRRRLCLFNFLRLEQWPERMDWGRV